MVVILRFRAVLVGVHLAHSTAHAQFYGIASECICIYSHNKHSSEKVEVDIF